MGIFKKKNNRHTEITKFDLKKMAYFLALVRNNPKYYPSSVDEWETWLRFVKDNKEGWK